METSLRYGGDSKILRIRAKEKIPFDSETHLEVPIFYLTVMPLKFHLFVLCILILPLFCCLLNSV